MSVYQDYWGCHIWYLLQFYLCTILTTMSVKINTSLLHCVLWCDSAWRRCTIPIPEAERVCESIINMWVVSHFLICIQSGRKLNHWAFKILNLIKMHALKWFWARSSKCDFGLKIMEVTFDLMQNFTQSREVKEFLSGALAGAMTKAALAPLETIRWTFFRVYFSAICISKLIFEFWLQQDDWQQW